MKNLIYMLFMLLTMGVINAQENFEWDIVTEAEGETKDQLYAKTKQFIAEAFVSAQDVIQNDDEESGSVLVKGSYVIEKTYSLSRYRAVIRFTTKLYVKDNKHRIIIKNVHSTNVRYGSSTRKPLLVADNYPEKKGMNLTGLTRKQYGDAMGSLRQNLQSLVDDYVTTMSEPFEPKEDW